MIEKISQFFREVRQEMGKVSWPTREELMSQTWVVLILSGLFAVFIFFVDTILSNIVQIFF